MNVLVITTQRWPLEDPFMEEVLAKGLPERGHRVTLLLQSDTRRERVEKVPWHGAEVWALPGCGRATVLARLRNVIVKPFQVNRVYRELAKSDVIFIRNDFLLAFWAFGIRRRHGTPVVFQYSFPAFAHPADSTVLDLLAHEAGGKDGHGAAGGGQRHPRTASAAGSQRRRAAGPV